MIAMIGLVAAFVATLLTSAEGGGNAIKISLQGRDAARNVAERLCEGDTKEAMVEISGLPQVETGTTAKVKKQPQIKITFTNTCTPAKKIQACKFSPDASKGETSANVVVPDGSTASAFFKAKPDGLTDAVELMMECGTTTGPSITKKLI